MVPYSERFNLRRSGRTTNRTDIKADTAERGTHYAFLYESNSVYVHVNKVRFTKDGLQPYANCDN